MAIEELLRVVTPPEQPLETGDAALWGEVQRLAGTRLPRGLSDFGMRYGAGQFVCRSLGLWVVYPFAPSYLDQLHLDRLHGFGQLLRAQRGLPARDGTPYGVFPDQPGWLVWGGTDNG